MDALMGLVKNITKNFTAHSLARPFQGLAPGLGSSLALLTNVVVFIDVKELGSEGKDVLSHVVFVMAHFHDDLRSFFCVRPFHAYPFSSAHAISNTLPLEALDLSEVVLAALLYSSISLFAALALALLSAVFSCALGPFDARLPRARLAARPLRRHGRQSGWAWRREPQ